MSDAVSAGRRAIAQLRAPVVLAIAAIAAVPMLYAVNPNTTHVPLCPLHAATGLNCPLCGATRATYELLHGQLSTALRDNALYVLGLPLLLFLWLRWYQAERGGGPRLRLLPVVAFRALIVAGAVFGIVRNLPFAWWLSPAE